MIYNDAIKSEPQKVHYMGPLEDLNMQSKTVAHLMASIPKPKLQAASEVSPCASAGAAPTVSSGLSGTSDDLGWSKVVIGCQS